MQIEKSTQFLRTQKRLIKRHILNQEEIEQTLLLFQHHRSDPSLHYKKMSCKKDKNRYSIKIPNTQYRILMTVNETNVILACVCDHGEYDMRNRNC